MIRNRGAAIYDVDLGKNLFHFVGTDSCVVQKAKFRRDTLLTLFECAEPAIVGMEACPRFAVACPQAAGNGPDAADRFGPVREDLYQIQQERFD